MAENEHPTVEESMREVVPFTPPKIDFAKRPIPSDAVFFAHPTRIGHLLAANSDWVPSQNRPFWPTVKSVFPWFAAGLGVGMFASRLLNLESDFLSLLCYLIPATLGIFVSFLLQRRYYSNLYIGSEGFAFYQRRPKQSSLTSAHEIRWDQVSALRIFKQEIQSKGEHLANKYQFYWYGSQQETPLFLLEVNQNNGETGPKTPPALMFAQVCEVQWTQLQIKQLDQKLNTQGFETFDYSHTALGTQTACIQLDREKIIFRNVDGEYIFHFDDLARLYWQQSPDGKPQKKTDKFAFFAERAKGYGIDVHRICNASYFEAALLKILNARFPNT